MAHVRPTAGLHARRLFVVEERFLFDLAPDPPGDPPGPAQPTPAAKK